jgi:flagellar FliL protein
MIVIMTLVVVLLTGAGTVTALYYTGYLGADRAASDTAANTADAAGDPSRETGKAPIYLPLEPPLVVNFDRQGRVGYLQAGLQLMARQQPVIDAAQRNMPMIRNSLLLLLGSQSYEEISSREGKERLRQKTLDEVNRVLGQVNAPGRIEAVYFTAFVMQ